MKTAINKFLFLSYFCLLSFFSVNAQNPVSLSMSVLPNNVASDGKGTAKISANIESGWYIYSVTQGEGGPIPTTITFDDGVFKIGEISSSTPKVKMDPNFGIETETHSETADFTVAFTVAPNTQKGSQKLNVGVRYQACNDTVCLPPKTVKLSAPVTVLAGKTKQPTTTPNANTEVNSQVVNQTNSNTKAVENTENKNANTNSKEQKNTVTTISSANLESQSLWGFIWLAMTFGALSLLTPCVFPMIPITVSYFTKNAAETRAGSIRDALIYALGIILTFTGLGIALAVVFGAAGLNQFAANPWINLLITGIFLAFAFSLLGAYNIGVPSELLNKIDKLSRSKESSKTIGLLLMGLTFSLTSFTCTAPLVGTILVSAASGKLFYPIVGMLAFSTVFALPFFVLAVAPRLLHSLPSSGGWMNALKAVMGFLEIGAALKFLSNADLVWGWGIFTREVVIAGWIGLSLLIFLYLLGVFRLSHDFGENKIGLVRLLNAFLFITVSFYLLTGMFGKKLGEIESFLPPAQEDMTNSASGTKSSGELAWVTNDYQAALKQAKAENKQIFIDFTGYTCTNCRWMEVNMFPKPKVRTELEKFVRVRLYTDGEGEPYEGFQKMQEERFGTVALPLYAIVSPDDQIISKFEGLTRDENEFATFLSQKK